MPLTGNNARYSVYLSTNEKHSGTEYRELLSYDLSWELDLTEVYNHINTPALIQTQVNMLQNQKTEIVARLCEQLAASMQVLDSAIHCYLESSSTRA